eukprot:GHVN01015693.1.p1 GENE.GHVN01015693.1~~GHVN01015693.1.p1  ORF type:complete len:843 (-),score=137.34 GHVN01015693.1:592-2943(-)
MRTIEDVTAESVDDGREREPSSLDITEEKEHRIEAPIGGEIPQEETEEPIVPQVESQKVQERGIPVTLHLEIEIIGARELKNADVMGLSDPYCQFEWKGHTFKTAVVKDTLNPEWNQSFRIPVEQGVENSPIRLTLYGVDEATRDKLWPLGHASIDLIEVLNTCLDGVSVKWVKLDDSDTGKLGLSFKRESKGEALVPEQGVSMEDPRIDEKTHGFEELEGEQKTIVLTVDDYTNGKEPSSPVIETEAFQKKEEEMIPIDEDTQQREIQEALVGGDSLAKQEPTALGNDGLHNQHSGSTRVGEMIHNEREAEPLVQRIRLQQQVEVVVENFMLEERVEKLLPSCEVHTAKPLEVECLEINERGFPETLPIEIGIIGAKGLMNADVMVPLLEPYCQFQWKGETFKTAAQNDTPNPEWNQSFTIPVEQGVGNSPIKFTVHDLDEADDLLGHTTIDVNEVVKELSMSVVGVSEKWVKLDDTQSGKLGLRFKRANDRGAAVQKREVPQGDATVDGEEASHEIHSPKQGIVDLDSNDDLSDEGPLSTMPLIRKSVKAEQSNQLEAIPGKFTTLENLANDHQAPAQEREARLLEAPTGGKLEIDGPPSKQGMIKFCHDGKDSLKCTPVVAQEVMNHGDVDRHTREYTVTIGEKTEVDRTRHANAKSSPKERRGSGISKSTTSCRHDRNCLGHSFVNLKRVVEELESSGGARESWLQLESNADSPPRIKLRFSASGQVVPSNVVGATTEHAVEIASRGVLEGGHKTTTSIAQDATNRGLHHGRKRLAQQR